MSFVNALCHNIIEFFHILIMEHSLLSIHHTLVIANHRTSLRQEWRHQLRLSCCLVD